MGSYSPVPGIDREHADALALAVHQPIVDELRRRGTPYHGVLYAGLMMTAGRPEGARVQLPLRRPRDAGRAAAAALGRDGAAGGLDAPRRARRRGARVVAGVGGDGGAGLGGLPGVVLEGRRDPRAALDRLARGGGAARRDGRGGRQDRDGGRARAERDRLRRHARARRAITPTRPPSGSSSTASRCAPTSRRRAVDRVEA